MTVVQSVSSKSAWAAGLLTALVGFGSEAAAEGDRQMYIVQTRGAPAATYAGGEAGLSATQPSSGQKLDTSRSEVQAYVEHLKAKHAEVAASAGIEKVRDYGLTLNGFAAWMTEAEAFALAARGDVIGVYPNKLYTLDTNITPEFLGLNERARGPWRRGITGEDVVIGVLDGGIWPEHPCFADVPTPRLGDVGRKIPYDEAPDGFTGTTCDFGDTDFNAEDAPFACNNKLVQASFYVDGFRDAEGNPELSPGECLSTRDCGPFGDHGTNVAGTAACNANTPAELDGEPEGVISGMAPRARISHYKVCWSIPTAPTGTCSNIDLVAAVEQAIADGVDVMNLSLGSASPIIGDAFDIALLNATAAGIYVATSAGNSGSGPGTTGSPANAPWVTAVGAMQDPGVEAIGVDITAPSELAGFKIGIEGDGPVAFEDTGTITGEFVLADSIFACEPLANAADIAGKIALVSRGVCAFDLKYQNAEAAGAIALVVFNDGADATRVDPFVMGGIAPTVTIPGIMISSIAGDQLASSAEPVFGGVDPSVAVSRGDRMATFSSRGPNGFTPDVLKPDLVAPGVQILSAGSPLGGIFDGGLFSVISGTSFSSPHMAGLFALIKEKNPHWSPAAARSAFVTSGRQNILETFRDDAATPFDIGGGMVVPQAALDTGLVYEAGLADYEAYACGQGIAFDGLDCAAVAESGVSMDPAQLNYPTITASSIVGEKVITRTVTNVSPRFRIWKAKVDSPEGFSVKVSPKLLFLKKGQSKTVKITIRAKEETPVGEWRFGSLAWKSGFGRGNAPVRSPISARKERFIAPEEVDVSGTEGSAEFDLLFGYSGEYTAQVHGLSENNADGLVLTTVTDDPTDTFAFFGPGTEIAFLAELPEGTAYARWELFDEYTSGATDDIDLYVFYCPELSCAQIASSATAGTSNELLEVAFPVNDPAIEDPYLVFAHGVNTDGGLPSDIILFDYNFGVVDDAGNLTVDAPASATFGTNAAIGISWSGLNAGLATSQIGAISHSDESGIQALTIIDVDNLSGTICDLGVPCR